MAQKKKIVDVRTMTPEERKKFDEDTANARQLVRKAWGQIMRIVSRKFTNGGAILHKD